MKKTTTARKASESQARFVRKTITIPSKLVPFAEGKSRQLDHAGSFSSYVRTLILRDRDQTT